MPPNGQLPFGGISLLGQEFSASEMFWRSPSGGDKVIPPVRREPDFGPFCEWRAPPAHAMTGKKATEYCLIVEGSYLSETEAEHALRDPFIEDWVEETGRFRLHNLGDIELTPGVVLGSLGIEMLDEGLFEIASNDPEHRLTEHKAKGVAAALRRHDMFEEISIEPRHSAGGGEAE